MRSLEVSLAPSKPGAPITIEICSCVHVGHNMHEREKTIEYFDRVLKAEDTYLVNLGDSGDNGTKQSPGGSVYENYLNPMEQAVVVATLFRPLVQRGKVLWWHDSNHSFRTFKESGAFTLEETVARLFFGDGVADSVWKLMRRYAEGAFDARPATKRAKLGYIAEAIEAVEPYLKKKPAVQWAGWQALTRVVAGKQAYTFHSMHGEGSCVAATSALAAVIKQRDIGLADLYVRGHHHKRTASDALRAEWSSGRPVYRRVGFLTTGCYLGYDNSYGEMKGYTPVATGMSRVVLATGPDRWFKLEV